MATLTISDITKMDAATINARWTEIAAILAAQAAPPAPEPWRDPGQPQSLTLADVRRMTPDQINRNWSRIQEALQRSLNTCQK